MFDAIKSQDFKKEISKILNKKLTEISDEDLESVEKISINKENIFGGINDYQISDLKFLKGLKQCSISGFEITDQDIDIINELPELEFLEFDFCGFKLVSNSVNNPKLEDLYLDNCVDFKISYVKSSNLKSLSIVGFKEDMDSLNLAGLMIMRSLEEIEIHNYKIENIINVISSAPNVKSINLDGSIVSEKDLLEEIKINGIKVSNESFFHLH
ncbi:MAG: hypothetical protein IJX99_10410 [Clostridia bacterium]|nr:hypothetical protein [Clostridia bacterium]